MSICLNYCNKIYDECKKAEYAGKTIEEIYKNGFEFCEAQDFNVIINNQQCFDFDSSPFSASIRISEINNKMQLTCFTLFLTYILLV